MRNTLSIVRKELRGYSDGAAIYIVAIVFLLLWQFLFFRNAFLVGEASLRDMFAYLPWLFLLLVPALTMGSISQERSEGTLEFLLTHPVRDRDLLLGKYLAAVSLAAGLLLFVVPVAASFEAFGNLDWGMLAAQYLAALLMACVLLALGLLVSSVLASQMAALLVTAAASLFLVIAGLDLVTSRLPLALAPMFEQLSVLTHFESMARGVVDLRDVWYFMSMVAVFLGFAYLQLLRRRFGGRKALYRSYQVGVLLFIGIAVLSNVVGSRIPGRVDLTEGRRYSLSDATRETVRDVDDLVNVTLYASGELPAQLQPTLRDVRDMLRDYETIGSGDIAVRIKDPTEKKQVAEEARSRGVQEVQFNVVGNEEFKVRKGFLGIVVSHGGKNEAIPFVQDTSDLEYQLTSIIRQLTTDKKQKVSFLTGHGEREQAQQLATFTRELGRQFEVTTATVEKGKSSLPKDAGVLVVAAPTQEVPENERRAIRRHLDAGGSALMLLEGVTVNQQFGSAQVNAESFADFLKPYGVRVESDLAYDLRSNVTASFGGAGGLSYLVPYAFWVRADAVGDHPVTKGLQGVALPWASTVEVDGKTRDHAGLTTRTLLGTSDAGGRQVGTFTIDPQQQPSAQDLARRTLAVAVTPKRGEKGPRMVVVGDADFVSDPFVQRSPENLAFAMQAASWLSQEASLASIQVKGKVERQLEFEDRSDTALVRYGNMALAALLPAAFGLWRLLRRRRLAGRTYEFARESGRRKAAA